MRKPFLRLFLFSFVVIFFHQPKTADAYNWPFLNWYFGGGYAPYGGYVVNGYTSAESYLYGLGAYADGLGRLHFNNARAAVHFQKAYKLYLENAKLRADTWYDLKRKRDEYYAARRPKPLTKEQKEAVANFYRNKRLTPEQFNRATGEIKWTRALRQEHFASSRKEMEALFHDRAKNPEDSGLDSDSFNQIKDLADAMLAEVRKRKDRITNIDLVAAVKLLNSIRYEARFKVGQ